MRPYAQNWWDFLYPTAAYFLFPKLCAAFQYFTLIKEKLCFLIMAPNVHLVSYYYGTCPKVTWPPTHTPSTPPSLTKTPIPHQVITIQTSLTHSHTLPTASPLHTKWLPWKSVSFQKVTQSNSLCPLGCIWISTKLDRLSNFWKTMCNRSILFYHRLFSLFIMY